MWTPPGIPRKFAPQLEAAHFVAHNAANLGAGRGWRDSVFASCSDGDAGNKQHGRFPTPVASLMHADWTSPPSAMIPSPDHANLFMPPYAVSEVSEAVLDRATAELEARDPLAAQVWKMYGEPKRRLPTGEAIEQLTWTMTGMGLGELRRRMDQSRTVAPVPSAAAAHHPLILDPVAGPSTFAAPASSTLPALTVNVAGPSTIDDNVRSRRSTHDGVAESSPERGRPGRSTARGQTADRGELMDWRTKSRSRSRPPETTQMDWRMASRSRSRQPFRLSMPLTPFGGDLDFGPWDSSTASSSSPTTYSRSDASAAVSTSATDEVENARILDQLLADLASPAVAPEPLTNGFSLFDFGSLGLPSVPSQSTHLGSVPGLPPDLASMANAHAEYGSLPRLVRKTSYDEAMMQNSFRRFDTGKHYASPASAGAYSQDWSRKRSVAPSPVRSAANQPAFAPDALSATFPAMPLTMSSSHHLFDFSFPGSLTSSPTAAVSPDPATFPHVDFSRVPAYGAGDMNAFSAQPIMFAPITLDQASSAPASVSVGGFVDYASLYLSPTNVQQPPLHVNFSQVQPTIIPSTTASRSGSSTGADVPSPSSLVQTPSVLQQPIGDLSSGTSSSMNSDLKTSASAPNLANLPHFPPDSSWSGGAPAPARSKVSPSNSLNLSSSSSSTITVKKTSQPKKERDRNVALQNPDGTPIQCLNCKTRNTPLWRRDGEGKPLCNACGLFFNLHGVARPVSLNTGIIKRRNRGKNSESKVKKVSTSTTSSSSKPTSRRNSEAGQSQKVGSITSTSPISSTCSPTLEGKRLRTFS